MKRIATILVLLGLLAIQNTARACLNDHDSDTLAHQSKQLPDVVRVITGRFERNPPLYYEMRIDRETKDLQKDPTRLPLYDDVAVAYDRLHRDDEAIQCIEKKRDQLEHLSGTNAEVHEHWYRYYANVGTFWAHRWLRSGADRTRIHEMEVARHDIAQALKLNPNAHFGRERYQLAAMRWIIDLPYTDYGSGPGSIRRPVALGEYIGRLSGKSELYPIDRASVEGLSGLIVLGDAWESVDIFSALGSALRDKVTLSYLARLRYQELVAAGHRSLHPEIRATEGVRPQETSTGYGGMWIQNQKAEQVLYRNLRAEAEQWQHHRTAYMMRLLRQGRHPDTDSTFWNDYHEIEPPSLEIPWHRLGIWARPEFAVPLTLIGFFVSVFLFFKLLGWVLWRRYYGKLAKAQKLKAGGLKNLGAGNRVE